MPDQSKLNTGKALWLVVLLSVMAISLYHVMTLDKGDIPMPAFADFLVDPQTHAGWFFVLLAILPAAGFPLSVFCLLAGMKFGVFWGSLTIGAAMVIHLLIAYWLGQSFLKQPLHNWLIRRGYPVREVPEHHQLKFAVTFVAIPVIPYAAKNYLLAMSRLRLRYYLGVTWTLQMLYSIPLVAITGAVQDNNPFILAAGLVLLLMVWGISRWARRSANRDRAGLADQKGPRIS